MGAVDIVWIDTNIIIYFLRANRDFTPSVKIVIDQANAGMYTLKVTPVVIGECVYVLMGKNFNIKKTDVATSLISFINMKGVEMEEKDVVEKALNQFAKKGVDYADAYIAEHAKAMMPPSILSVNVKDFMKLGISVYTPTELMSTNESQDNGDDKNP